MTIIGSMSRYNRPTSDAPLTTSRRSIMPRLMDGATYTGPPTERTSPTASSGVRDAVVRLGVDQGLDEARTPARLLQDFAGASLFGGLQFLDQAHGQLPGPRVSNEAVPPHHQDLLAVIDHGGHGQVPEANDVVLPPAPVNSALFPSP